MYIYVYMYTYTYAQLVVYCRQYDVYYVCLAP